MELDLRLLLTIGGLLCSIIAAAAIAKHQIASLVERIAEIQKQINTVDLRLDKNDTETSNLKRTIDVLGEILSPANLERRTHAMAQLEAKLEHLKQDINYIKTRLHKNGS